MNFRQICISLLLGVVPAVFATADYCNPELCEPNKTHIACGHNFEFGPACGPNSHLVNLTYNISQIVNKHNSLRNLVAGGFEHLPPAEHMATMEWDDKLAKLAELNVKQCQMKLDQCRNTDQYRHVGQNLGMLLWADLDYSPENFIDKLIQDWFDVYKLCPVKVIRRYPKYWNGGAISTFTTMLQEKNNRIGCAVSSGEKRGMNYQYFACNYAYTTMVNDQVYSAGRAASKCRKGNNPKYPNLCSPLEVYN